MYPSSTGTLKENAFTRRELFSRAGRLGKGVAAYAFAGLWPAWLTLPEKGSGRILSHQDFLNLTSERIGNSAKLRRFVPKFKELMTLTAESCVLDNGNWVIPSQAYANYFFCRDSFWVLAALNRRDLCSMAVRKFRDDQIISPDGHIATALYKDGSRPENRDRDEESTLIYVLHNLLFKRLGGEPDKASLEKAYQFIASHVRGGRYLTTGETRVGALFDGINQIGTYHYWADTFRPAGGPAATEENISYNQSLYCVALAALEEMGVHLDPSVRQQAENAYASTLNPEDSVSLPQRANSTIMDVSALVGEALSLYFFDRAILSRERLAATMKRLTKVWYPDGTFLGLKVISDFYGLYRPNKEFSGSPSNYPPGNYHNGGSWMLYDILALYAAARHGVPGSFEQFLQRTVSEVKHSWASHEFISTNPATRGRTELYRDNYGWNSFARNLLPDS